VLQNGQHVMNPVVGLGLAQTELQAVHRLQRVGLLIDQDEQQLIGYLRQDAFGSATDLALAHVAFQGLVRRIQCPIGGGKRRQQTGKFFVRQSGCSQKISGSVF
jgi:hypothetical protein